MQKVLIILTTIFCLALLILGILYLDSQKFNFGTFASSFLTSYIHPNSIKPIEIAGSSMSPNYNDGQFWVVDQVIYNSTNPQRGDVVLFKDVTNSNNIYAKRIIGLPGEKIGIKDGAVYINNQILSEPYLSKDTTTTPVTYPSPNPTIITQGNYFIMGDNRANSSDSRHFGFVPRENIIGKLTTCYQGCTK